MYIYCRRSNIYIYIYLIAFYYILGTFLRAISFWNPVSRVSLRVLETLIDSSCLMRHRLTRMAAGAGDLLSLILHLKVRD